MFLSENKSKVENMHVEKYFICLLSCLLLIHKTEVRDMSTSFSFSIADENLN